MLRGKEQKIKSDRVLENDLEKNCEGISELIGIWKGAGNYETINFPVRNLLQRKAGFL